MVEYTCICNGIKNIFMIDDMIQTNEYIVLHWVARVARLRQAR